MDTINLKIVTPVAIGAGEILSPYGDFILARGRYMLHVLDHKKIKEALTKQSNLIDDYVQGVATGMDNNRSNFNLKSFLLNRLHLRLNEVTKAAYSISPNVDGHKQLHTIIKNASSHPYIPGSTIKGAIKTALLYNWLTKENEGKRWLEEYIEILGDDEERVVKEKELKEQLQSYTELTDNGKLAVSDSNLLPPSSIKVYHTEPLHLKDKSKSGIPLVWETIDKGSSLSFKIDAGKIGIRKVMSAIRHFSEEANGRIFDLLYNLKNNVDKNTYKQLSDSYDNIEERLIENEETLMRLGFGKGYFFNSVGLAVYDFEDGKYFPQFLKTYEHEDIEFPQHFPVTQLIETFGNQPLGWVCVEKQ